MTARPKLVWIGFALAVLSLTGPSAGWARSKRLRPPPDVTLHPDRGMTFSRFGKTSHDQRVFKSLNQGTRLPVMDPSIDPYNLNLKSSVYEPQTGQIRGSLNDAYTSVRRAQEASHRAAREARASSTAEDGTAPTKRKAGKTARTD
jgi:hypothetical protein